MTIEITTTNIPNIFSIGRGIIMLNNYVCMTRERFGELCMDYYDYHEILLKLKIVHFFEKLSITTHVNEKLIIFNDIDYYKITGVINYYTSLLIEEGRDPNTELEMYRITFRNERKENE